MTAPEFSNEIVDTTTETTEMTDAQLGIMPLLDDGIAEQSNTSIVGGNSSGGQLPGGKN